MDHRSSAAQAVPSWTAGWTVSWAAATPGVDRAIRPHSAQSQTGQQRPPDGDGVCPSPVTRITSHETRVTSYGSPNMPAGCSAGNLPVMISIAICTYNNAKKLAVALESLRDLTCPPGVSYEILVIDNNSRDETRDVVRQWQGAWGPRLRYVFEERQGLSHARNRAWREAAGDIVSYLDDDVKVDSGWLTAVAAAFAEHAAAVVGGRSYLIYPSQRPAWLPEKYEILLSRLDHGAQVLVDTDRELFGVNFSVRKDWLDRVGGFDASLGRHRRSLSSGEERDLLQRIRARGGIAVYEPRAV
ncbi:MAG: glycosyltransferase family 2 protein, partial [Planctomycetes bacterium]|nr:glycosyltransferase family 2 protein [Planctomycetota bacterium]